MYFRPCNTPRACLASNNRVQVQSAFLARLLSERHEQRTFTTNPNHSHIDLLDTSLYARSFLLSPIADDRVLLTIRPLSCCYERVIVSLACTAFRTAERVCHSAWKGQQNLLFSLICHVHVTKHKSLNQI